MICCLCPFARLTSRKMVTHVKVEFVEQGCRVGSVFIPFYFLPQLQDVLVIATSIRFEVLMEAVGCPQCPELLPEHLFTFVDEGRACST